ncbi:hypothetical protein PSYAR_30965, partial [Pseudomonas syringae pv. aceris str. M302273]
GRLREHVDDRLWQYADRAGKQLAHHRLRKYLTAGYSSSLIAGYGSTQTAGYESTLTAGYGSTQTAQERSDLVTGYGSTSTAGYASSLIAG